MRKTKIICTLGPASANEEVITALVNAGMNVVRLNFSHGTYEDHAERIEMVKNVRDRLGVPIAILLDTKGPEYRVGKFAGGKAELKDGDVFLFTADDIQGDDRRVSVSYKKLAEEMQPGDRILVNNGLLVFEVTGVHGADVVTKVIAGGVISDNKSMSFPGKVLKLPYLSEQDKKDLLFGIEHGIDYVACSFVSCAQDLIDLREFVDANGGEDLLLIAKIENQAGVDNIDEICEASDGIMIGRGDMGVEIPFEELPAIQKHLIMQCRRLGKRVITATEMLESMISNPRPTRAEISDVANAVYDGTSAVMLSGETAVGKYPALTAATMAKIVTETEKNIHYRKRFYATDFKIKSNIDAVSRSACTLAMDIDAKAISVCSMSGTTARLVSRFRPPIDIVGICTDERVYRQLALAWGVIPVMSEKMPSIEVLFYNAMRLTKRLLSLQKGDNIIVTGGQMTGAPGHTNTIRIETID
ncbi:MAG: pyruvate kinase [Christensenellales bacterium]|jgi:pyruvate kinase